MVPVPLTARIVEVIADLGENTEPRYKYGSGCIAQGRTVLTAAHVVAGAETVQVRRPDKVLLSASLNNEFLPAGNTPDLALLDIEDELIDLPPIKLARVDRDSPEAKPVQDCHAVGYPWFAEKPSPTAVRDTVDAWGHIPVLSKLAEGLLTVQVSPSPERAALIGSEWSGMSGAPVVAEGGLVGVVVEHAPREGPSAITAVPLSALEYDPVHPGWGSGVDNAPQWWARLGVSGLEELRWLPARKTRREPAYWATVRAIHARTEQLEGRTRELADLAAFATGPGGYRWLTGQAWAGKTALAAEVCTSARPPSVDVVAYFLSRQEADANSNRFLAAVVPQLAYLLDEDPPAPSLEEFRDLWSRAADHLAREKRLLLLVVDGLDEDLHPQGMPSIASLLPSEVAASAHVLVTSRPDLRPDFVAGHPLQAVSQVKLDPSPHAQNLAKLASQELRDLLHGDDQDLAAEILGVLTAAAGALTIDDLTTLADDLEAATPARSRQVERLVTERAARSLRSVDAEEPRRYQFTHGSLLEQAQTDPDLAVLRHPAYRRRIDRWADQWRDVGWPAWHIGEPGTPRYLLDVYPHLLLGKQVGSAPEGERAESAAQPADLRRLAALVSDVRWVDSAVCTIGLDSVLQVLGTTAELVPDETSVTSVLRLLQLQAHNLRPTSSTVRPGLTATQLCCEALRTGHEDIARAAASHAEHCPAPQLIPRWTTGRTSSHLVSVVGRHDGFVNAVAVLSNGLVVSAGQNGTVTAVESAQR